MEPWFGHFRRRYHLLEKLGAHPTFLIAYNTLQMCKSVMGEVSRRMDAVVEHEVYLQFFSADRQKL